MSTRIHFSNYDLSVPDNLTELKELVDHIEGWAEGHGCTDGDSRVDITFNSSYEDEEVSLHVSCARYRTEEEEESFLRAAAERQAKLAFRNKAYYETQIRAAFSADPDSVRDLIIELYNSEGDQ